MVQHSSVSMSHFHVATAFHEFILTFIDYLYELFQIIIQRNWQVPVDKGGYCGIQSFFGESFCALPKYFVFLVGLFGEVFDIFLHFFGTVHKCFIGTSEFFNGFFLSPLEEAKWVMDYALPKGT